MLPTFSTCINFSVRFISLNFHYSPLPPLIVGGIKHHGSEAHGEAWLGGGLGFWGRQTIHLDKKLSVACHAGIWNV